MANCQICKRQLTDPESIKRGIGPVCYGKVLGKEEEERMSQYITYQGDIICKRTEQGPVFNIPHLHKKHSPSGMEWGYGGSGPADFALNALATYIGREAAERDGLYQEFKWDFIAPMPFLGGTIKRKAVIEWLAVKGIKTNILRKEKKA